MESSTILSGPDVMIGLIVGMIGFCAALIVTQRSPDRKAIRAAFLVKLLACYAMCALTMPVFQGGDMTGYHNHGILFAEMLRGDLIDGTTNYLTTMPFFLPLGNNVSRCQSLSGLVHVLVLDSYIGSSLIFAWIGFAGQMLIYRTFVSSFPDPHLRPYWKAGILFIPSLTFWSAALLKDPLGIWGMGCAFWGAYRLLLVGQPMGILRIILGIYTLALFRVQVVPVILLAMSPLLLSSTRMAYGRSRNAPLPPWVQASLRIALVPAVIGVIACITLIDGRVDINNISDSILKERHRYTLVYGGSTVMESGEDLRSLSSSPLGIALHWPEAVIFALFRPFLWEGLRSPLYLAASLENTVLLALTVRTLFRVARAPRVVPALLRTPLFLTCLTFVAMFAFAVGLSTPNLGTVSRYRIPVIPFFVGILFIADYTSIKYR